MIVKFRKVDGDVSIEMIAEHDEDRKTLVGLEDAVGACMKFSTDWAQPRPGDALNLVEYHDDPRE